MTPFEFLIKVQRVQSDFPELDIIVATNKTFIYVDINNYIFVCNKVKNLERKTALTYQHLLNYLQNEIKYSKRENPIREEIIYNTYNRHIKFYERD